MTPEQRQQLVKSLLPWKNQQGGRSSGNFRKSLNIPQQGHHAHKNSDVTMRSVSKPQKTPYLIEESTGRKRCRTKFLPGGSRIQPGFSRSSGRGRSEVVKINVQNTDHLPYIELPEFQGLESPTALVTVKAGSFKTTVVNSTDENMFIYDKSPIELEAYSETKNEFVELNTLNVNIDVDKELCDNLNKIRTGHMNEEEKREITRLCYRYRDIFHSENVPLTFTHAVKHQLRLSNDTPIYVRSYRQAPQQRAEIRNQVDNLLKQVNLEDNEDDELIGRIFENVRITQQNDRQTDDEPMAGPSRQDDNLDPDVQLDPQSPSIEESAIDKNQLTEVELVSTNNTQPDNENNGIPILSDAIDRQLKQFHIRSTPGHTRTISIPDCLEFKITTNACRGFCESWSLPSIMLGFKRHPVTSLGQCCNIMEAEDIPAKVLCLDGERNLIFKSALSCACYHCQKE
ncbi:unnamed protein product [Pieris brassicae]|uniref:DAN domain-containing protein n=1 Tax=Pieris brassicae TaxID=7116 RepID=A0A9P0TZH7_PIEBR|nr:unnamed protein product [Pieris brassicae]